MVFICVKHSSLDKFLEKRANDLGISLVINKI